MSGTSAYQKQFEVLVNRLTRWKRGIDAPIISGEKALLSHVVLRFNDGIDKQATRWDIEPAQALTEFVEGVYSYIADHSQGFGRGIRPAYYLTIHFNGLPKAVHDWQINTDHLYTDEDGEPMPLGRGPVDARLRGRDGLVDETSVTMLELVRIMSSSSDAKIDRVMATQDRIIERLLNRNENLENKYDRRTIDLEDANDRKELRHATAEEKKFVMDMKRTGLAALPAVAKKFGLELPAMPVSGDAAKAAAIAAIQSMMDMPEDMQETWIRTHVAAGKVTAEQADQIRVVFATHRAQKAGGAAAPAPEPKQIPEEAETARRPMPFARTPLDS